MVENTGENNSYGGAEIQDDDNNLFMSEDETQEGNINGFNPLNQQNEEQGNETKGFTYKKLALTIAGLAIVVALVLLFFDKIHIGKKNDTPTTQVQQTQEGQQVTESNNDENQDTPQNQVEQPSQQSSDSVSEQNNVGFKEVPKDTKIDYDVMEEEGVGQIVDKKVFISNSQLIYRLDVVLEIDGVRKTVNYYCGYGVYSQVGISDVVTVTYQKVSKRVISVLNLSR